MALFPSEHPDQLLCGLLTSPSESPATFGRAPLFPKIKIGDRVLYTNGVGHLPVEALVSGVFEFLGRPSYAILTSAGQRIHTCDDYLWHVQPVRRGVSCDEDRRTRSLRRVEIRPWSLGSRHHPR